MTDNDSQLVLASASPRRRELLEQVGLSFLVHPSQADESELPGETPEEHVMRLSRVKAKEVADRMEIPGRFFLGSDTIVLRDNEILGKPADAEEAATMLRSLAGRSHQVISGFAIVDRATGQVQEKTVTTQVWFRPLTDREIDGYIASAEPMDKAGAYGIQGLGAFMVSRIEGSYSNVVGLPLCEVVQALEAIGAISLFCGDMT